MCIYTVLTCRPTFQPPWGFRTHLTPLALNRLTPSQAEAMVQGMLGGHRLPAAVLEQIVAKTDGIPLFVEEVTKAVLEAGYITDSEHQDEGSGAAPAAGDSRHPARGVTGPARSVWGAPKAWRNWGLRSGASLPIPCCEL